MPCSGPRSRRSRCWRRGWGWIRSGCGCCAPPTRARPPWCCGRAQAASSCPPRRCEATYRAACSTNPPRWRARATPTTAAAAASEEAGIGPAALDVVECQDTDAGRELLSWYELGLCGAGDQRKLLRAEAEPGAPPGPAINRSGGLLSKGEPLGASGLGQVVELVRQL